MLNKLFSIASRFGDTVTGISPLGNGLINDTYLVSAKPASFVLQRINREVFPEPGHIMSNLATLNRHIEQNTHTALRLQVPAAIPTNSGQALFRDEQGDFWRALSFIENSATLETIRRISDAEQVGFALGHFHLLTSDLDPGLLHDTLPGFHISPRYLAHYYSIVPQANVGLNETVRYCAEFIERHQSIANDLEDAVHEGALTLRIIHGDPKLNNFLFDRDCTNSIGIIDLDTVKPGLIHYDIGDCLRSCCRSEQSPQFDLDICAAILSSYLDEAGAFFSDQDYRYLYPAIRLIPFELGIRFFTDYLEGNRYFKVNDPEQNLRRAADQFHLCESIIHQENALKALITRLQNRTAFA